MQREALAVVEAARGLGIRKDPSANMGVSLGCPFMELPVHLRRLSEALEQFDRAGGITAEPESAAALRALAAVIRWAGDNGLDAEGAFEAIEGDLGSDTDMDHVRKLIAPLALRPQPGEYGPMDKVDIDDLVSKIRNASCVISPEASLDMLDDEINDLGDMAANIRSRLDLAPGIDPAQKLELTKKLDSVSSAPSSARPVLKKTPQGLGPIAPAREAAAQDMQLSLDKLRFAVEKVGWTPRLKALAAAYIGANLQAFKDAADMDKGYIRIPVKEWSAIGAAVAEVTLTPLNLPDMSPRRRQQLVEEIEAVLRLPTLSPG